MHAFAEQLKTNVARIHDRIRAASERAGRSLDEVRLVAVTKYATPEVVQALVSMGTTRLGESRPQRLWELGETLSGDIEWHLIGHLQRNKVARTLPFVHLVHSVDSERLLREINKSATAREAVANCLLEVNISGDESKHGWRAEEVAAALETASRLNGIQIQGLMTMAARAGGVSRAAHDFEQLRQLRDALQAGCPEAVSLDELSMGMSSDFEVAIEHGATLVRVGSALFEGI